MYNKRSIGSEYETRAVNYLEKKGYEIIERNFYCRQGEIDIIAKDKEYIVFVEVKYRTNTKKGLPQEAVNYNKKNKIIRTAKYYMYKNGISQYQAIRFDVVSMLDEKIKIIKDAFWIN